MARRFVLFIMGFLSWIGVASAEPPYDTVTPYDLANLGVPRFINTNFLDLAKVNQLTKFRSDSGHDYSDNLEFGSQSAPDPTTGKPEACRSMKHYFYGVAEDTAVYSPVAGTVTGVDLNGTPDYQVGIQPDAQPAFGINIFHVVLDQPLTVGQHLAEGQRIGHHPDGKIYPANDIAVFVKSIQGFHLVSYFETLTDAALAPFLARGLTSASELIYTQAQRDAAPFQCTQAGNPPMFINLTADPSTDYVPLTLAAATQTISWSSIPLTLTLGGPPLTIKATASSGQPVTLSTTSPAICSISGNVVTPIATGQCNIILDQPGNPNLYEAIAEAFTVVTAGINAGPIYSSVQGGSQSFLRFYNTGTTAGTVKATLSDYATGNTLAIWTSPSIAPGAEQQYAIATLEGVIGPGIKLPAYYSLLIQPNIAGSFQHVLYRPDAATLTNLSTCSLGVGANPVNLSAVHSSLLGNIGYPSTIVVNNTGMAAATVTLGLYDARDGSKLGTYTTARIAANAKAILSVAAIEAAINLTPASGLQHYIVKAEGNFTGFLQHLVTNQQSNVVTDMTTTCALDGSTAPYMPGPLQSGMIFSSAQPASQSFLRFYNPSPNPPGTVTVTLSDYLTGSVLGQWTSPTISSGSEQQFAIATLEGAIGSNFTKPAYYALSIAPTFYGYFQHVLWHQADGTLTNLSTCGSGASVEVPLTISGVHSSLVGAQGYPSTIAINNAAAVPMNFPLYIHDARDGTYFGLYEPPMVPANGVIFVDVPTIEKALNIKPTGNMYHYVITSFIQELYSANESAAQPGYLQHLVNNQQAGVITDMTTACALRP